MIGLLGYKLKNEFYYGGAFVCCETIVLRFLQETTANILTAPTVRYFLRKSNFNNRKRLHTEAISYQIYWYYNIGSNICKRLHKNLQ